MLKLDKQEKTQTYANQENVFLYAWRKNDDSFDKAGQQKHFRF